ncbi:MAG: outer membrane beta-barrel protein [Nitrospira sp.]
MVWRGHGKIRWLALVVACLISASPFSLVRAQPVHELESEQAVSAAVEPATTIFPSLRIAERYDTNVFFVPGRNLEDFVTTISPQLQATHKNQWVKGTVGAGATSEVYVKNPGLNYVGGNGTLDLDLDGAASSLLRGLGLRVSDSIVYTPQPPAFAAPIGGSQISEAFVQGIQARRANSFTNAALVQASYQFSSFMGASTTYSDRRIRFGTPLAIPTGVTQGGFRDTNFQTLTSGVDLKVSLSDTLSLFHQYQKGNISDPERGDTGFSTQGAFLRWARSITPTLQGQGEGGFTVISSTGDTYPTGAASLLWKEEYTTVQLSYSQGVAPSFFAVSTPLLSQAVTGTVRRRITEPLSLSLSGSYALNQSIPNRSLVRFESYLIMPSLEYKIGPVFTATLSYTHSEFRRSFSGQSFDFDRNMIMVTLLAEWR